jgi:BASS family bile acid:Na+ symporter
MEPIALIKLGVTVSIALTVFAIGLETAARDLMSFLRRPELMIRSLLAMGVIMPLVAVAIATAFRLEQAVSVALVALALSPVPPILPRQQLSVSDDEPFVLGLLTIGSAVSIVVAPLVLELLGRAFGRELAIAPRVIAAVLATTVFLPIAAGQLLHRLWPSAARLIRPVAANAAGGLLAVLVLVLIVVARRPIWDLVGNGTLLAMVFFAAIGLLVGHLLGGPDRGDRAVLALATASRHPGVAIAIAGSTTQVQHVGAAVLLYLIVSGLVAAPYVARSRGRRRDLRPRTAESR